MGYQVTKLENNTFLNLKNTKSDIFKKIKNSQISLKMFKTKFSNN